MKNLVIFFFLLFSLQVLGQDFDSEVSKITPVIQMLQNFSENIPQEKVYLHFDNTGYYQGDNIWFKCYVVTSGEHQLSDLSKTLYVELLNPGGEIINKLILPVENGQCHGDFSLTQLPFYSGFYEVRAYTKYMLNFGEDVIFSRLLPVFSEPKTEGNYEEKEMLPYGRWGTGNYPMKRERPVRENRVNLRFFPEGGNLIQGVATRVAFEATDEAGNPIDVTGAVKNAAGQELSQISTLHEGRGIFVYTPTGAAGRRRDVAEVEYSGRKYSFDLPAALPQGVTMVVDNLTYPDSIEIILQKNGNTPAGMLGVAVLNGGTLQNYNFVWVANSVEIFKMDKMRLPAGVSQIVLFNSTGEIICDRLIFTGKKESQLDIKIETGKRFYMPYELVDMEINVTDSEANPVNTTFSLSVRDGANEVESRHNILTDLLLMSEIKGYVRNPAYYFEDGEDDTRRRALDILLMVQGWRRYSWEQMAGVEDFEIKYFPEEGIEVNGKVVSLNLFGKQVPKPDVDVSLVLYELGTEGEQGTGTVAFYLTDDLGRFSFLSNLFGKWDMFLSTAENGKQRNYMILLDRVFSPNPKRYRYSDLQVKLTEKSTETIIIDEETPKDIEDDYAAFFSAYQDSLKRLGIEERVHQLGEVSVSARRITQTQEIFRNRSTSVAYYDVASEADDIYDRGKRINDIKELVMNMNKRFSTIRAMDRGASYEDLLMYNGKVVLVIIDYEPYMTDPFTWQSLEVNSIKSIYINETASVICQYSNPRIPCGYALEAFSCVLFIETYPDGEKPVDGAKGVRKTWLEGYSTVREFYAPNYSGLLSVSVPDYRRTLYWNPSVTTDKNGIAKINFYNNSSCTDFNVSAETVTQQGMIGIYRDK